MINGNTGRLPGINRILGRIAHANQGHGYLKTAITLSHYWRRTNGDRLNAQQQQELEVETSIALAGIVWDLGSHAAEYGLVKLGHHLAHQQPLYTASGIQFATSHSARAAGLKLARYGGPALSILSSGFDIYSAHRDFLRLGNATSQRSRIDLIVSGAISSSAAAVSIATALAIAAGGTAATIGAPLGIAAGIALALGGNIYATARQIEDIKQYVSLTPIEELYNGWRAFWGAKFDAEVINAVMRSQSRQEAEKTYETLLTEKSVRLLEHFFASTDIDTLYYSYGRVKLKEHFFRKIVERNLSPRMRYGGFGAHSVTLEDKIPAAEIESRLAYHRANRKARYFFYDLRQEISEFTWYDFDGCTDTDELIDASKYAKSWLPDTATKTTALFNLGGGSDRVTGHRYKKNSFVVAAGTKRFTGGYYSDSFLLMGQPLPEIAGLFDGGELPETAAESDDGDIIIAMAKPAEGRGYAINLNEGYAGYAYTKNKNYIARLRHIEHAQGHQETDDLLTGNEADNQLNGAGGYDILDGRGGDDVLTLQEGYADGGKGIDSYVIMQNTSSWDVEVLLQEAAIENEVNNIRLDYRVEQIESVTLVHNDIVIALRNDNASLTTLHLQNSYSTGSAEQKKTLLDRYILYTHDGMMLLPLWPSVLCCRTEENERFNPALQAQYVPFMDQAWQKNRQEFDAQAVNVHLQQADNHGRGHLTVAGRDTVLPEFISLATEGSALNDYIEGNDTSNLIKGHGGRDRLKGKGGEDFYLIPTEETGDEIVIDNYDEYRFVRYQEGSAQVLDLDILLFGIPINQIQIDQILLEQQDDDIILRHTDAAALHSRVRVLNFMTDERYRHLALMDKAGGLYHLSLNEEGRPFLSENQLTENQLNASENQLTENQLSTQDNETITTPTHQLNHENSDLLVTAMSEFQPVTQLSATSNGSAVMNYMNSVWLSSSAHPQHHPQQQ